MYGLKLPKEVANGTVHDFENHLFNQGYPDSLNPEEIINKIHKLEVPDAERQAYLSFFREYYSNMNGNGLFPVNSGKFQTIDDFFSAFNGRYSPNNLIANGAPAEVVSDSAFSFLSSQESYDQMKKMMIEVQLARTNYSNPEFWREIAKQGKAKGHDSYSISISNIIDYVADKNGRKSRELMVEFCEMLKKELGTENIIIHVTGGLSNRHQYDTIDLRRPLNQQLDLYGY